MKVINKGDSPIHIDQEGDAYFYVGDTVYYINEFMIVKDGKHDAIASISNTGGIGIKINDAEEYVNYEIFTT
jgi:hypothetical protein